LTWSNYLDVRSQLEAAGLVIVGELQVDLPRDKFARCKVSGGDGEKRGWYKLFTAPESGLLVGAYGIWSATDPQKFTVQVAKDERKTLTAEAWAAIRARQADDQRRADAARAREIEACAVKAARWWRQLADAGESGYMAKKGFAAGELFGARISPSGNLVVPVQDLTGRTWGLQVIYPTKSRHGRDKDFTPAGLAKKCHCFQLGLAQRGGVVLLCEGFATGASLYKATGLPVVVAFDAGNLLPVAQSLHKAHRHDVRILVCADDDYQTAARTGKNPGRDAAAMAALAVGGAVVWPIFPGERPEEGQGKGPTDFNDLHTHPDGGLRAVAVQIEAAIASAGWRAGKGQGRPVSPIEGGGDRATEGGAPGGKGSDRRRACSVMAVDDLVERFIPLDDGTGKVVFDTWTHKPAHRDQMLALLPAGARGDDIKRHPTWIERGAAYLDEVGFDPSGKDRAVRLNTWRGWPLEPKEGGCDRLLELLAYLCNVEDRGDEVYTWLLKWMAYPLQHPGAKMSSAVIMHGPQGTGKSTVFQTLASIYGDYATVLNQRGLEDRFNADWIDSKLFILAEEVVTRAEMWHIRDELKELVTGKWIRVNPKFQGAYRQRNQVNIVYLSNHGQPLPLENDDRRHLVVWTPPMLPEDYYDEVFLELENGGTEAFYWYLLHKVDTTGFHPKKRPPMTDAKRQLIHISLPSELRFAEDYLGGDTPWPIGPSRAADLYVAYTRYCRANGEQKPRPSNQFFGSLTRLPGWSKAKKRIHAPSGLVLCPIVIPPEPAMQAAGTAHGPGQAQTDWLTTAVERFADSLKDAAWSAS
jgi:putative DNA primase/helicase